MVIDLPNSYRFHHFRGLQPHLFSPAFSAANLMKPLSVTPTFKLFTRLFSITYSYYPPIPRNPSSILKAGQAPRLPGATMSTLRQIEANQRNAQKSTGPTSVTGKATSSMNALKTGIDAKSLVLPSENRAHLDQLIDDYFSPHQPASPDGLTPLL